MKNNSLVGLLALLACSSVFRSTWAADEQVEDDEDDEDEPERRPGFGTKHRVLEFAEDNLEEIFDTHVHLVLFINGEEDGFDAVMDEFEALSMEYEPGGCGGQLFERLSLGACWRSVASGRLPASEWL